MCLTDTHNRLENTTTRLAIRVQNYPPFQFSREDNTPQKSRSQLSEDDVLPNEEDGRHLHQRMLDFMMRFLVNEFPSLSDLRQFLPTKQQPQAQRSEVLPMKLLFRDEKYIDENIQILLQLYEDAKLKGTPQMHNIILNQTCIM